MLICWAQYIVSGGGITLFVIQDNDKEKVSTKSTLASQNIIHYYMRYRERLSQQLFWTKLHTNT